jgi:cell division protein ZapA (FtsZ GTPase activity inhibitor)
MEIMVWGQKMKLTSDEDETFVSSVADLLNVRMQEVKTANSAELNTHTIALQAAYLIAADFLKLQNEIGELELTLERIDKTFAGLQP